MKSICFVGNYAPRCCGIATFTQDLRSSVLRACEGYVAPVIVVQGEDDENAFPSEVSNSIAKGSRNAYAAIARQINETGAKAVSLQHEFGIFGGPDGEWIVDMLQHLKVPVVTTFHTVLREPTQNQRDIVQAISAQSAKIVVMAEKGAEFLRSIYSVPASKIEVVPHGIPDLAVTAADSAQFRKEMGWDNRPVLLTFGLLSPNKGVEHAISALPAIVRQHPDVLYVIAGATHPNLVRHAGESYRESLVKLAEELGVTRNVAFIDRFIPEKELVSLIAAADVYLTPYLSEAQITSGTLAFAFGLGKPVISTPYWYAQELLDGGAGVLVPFGDSQAIGQAASDLLSDDNRRSQMGATAGEKGHLMRWNCVGRQYAALLLQAVAPPSRVQVLPAPVVVPASPVAPLSFHQLEQMTGAFGIYQHGVLNGPDPRHGFCADDNARVVVLLSGMEPALVGAESETLRLLKKRCLESLWDSYNPRKKRFRNFMDVNGRWLEEAGSEDSHGRVLWAIGVHLARLPTHSRPLQKAMLFLEGLLAARNFSSPRAWAFTLLGIGHFCATGMARPFLQEVQKELADRLVRLYRQQSGPGWHWFEDSVTYDNAKFSEALLMTYALTGTPAYLDTALGSLEFLLEGQTARAGYFRPVGCQGFWHRGSRPAQFDQQPLEAQAMTAACLRASAVTGIPHWTEPAQHCYSWFTGNNDHGLAMGLPSTGGCYDGLMEGGVNQNQGAESILAYMQSSLDLRKALARPVAAESSAKSIPRVPVALRDHMLSA